jgi:hypothetical protein
MRVVKWWDRFWGAVWMVGSAAVAYLTGRWFAQNAAPADLGGLRYGLIVFSGLFGLLVGAFVLSLTVIGITTGVEWLFARAGHPMRPLAPSPLAIAPDAPAPVEAAAPEESDEAVPAQTLKVLGGD